MAGGFLFGELGQPLGFHGVETGLAHLLQLGLALGLAIREFGIRRVGAGLELRLEGLLGFLGAAEPLVQIGLLLGILQHDPSEDASSRRA